MCEVYTGAHITFVSSFDKKTLGDSAETVYLSKPIKRCGNYYILPKVDDAVKFVGLYNASSKPCHLTFYFDNGSSYEDSIDKLSYKLHEYNFDSFDKITFQAFGWCYALFR